MEFGNIRLLSIYPTKDVTAVPLHLLASVPAVMLCQILLQIVLCLVTGPIVTLTHLEMNEIIKF